MRIGQRGPFYKSLTGTCYDQQLRDHQRELAEFIDHLLGKQSRLNSRRSICTDGFNSAIVANVEEAHMSWSPRQYWQRVVRRYQIAVLGWPGDVPFRSPHQISSLNQIGQLCQGWITGQIRFRRLLKSEFREVRMQLRAQITAEADLRRESRRGRDDKGKRRQLRSLATRGIHRRTQGGIKSNEYIGTSGVDETMII